MPATWLMASKSTRPCLEDTAPKAVTSIGAGRWICEFRADIWNRIAHDENLLRVRFPKLRHDMFFILNALDAASPNWAFPDHVVPLKALNPLQVVKDFRISYAFIEKE